MQQLASTSQLPPVHTLGIMSRGMEYPFGQFRSGVLAMSPHSFLCTCSLADHGKRKSPWLGVSTTQQQLKFQCVINIILIFCIFNTEQSTMPATKKKIHSMPAETRAGYKPFYSSSWGSHPEIFKVGKKHLTWTMFWQRGNVIID